MALLKLVLLFVVSVIAALIVVWTQSISPARRSASTTQDDSEEQDESEGDLIGEYRFDDELLIQQTGVDIGDLTGAAGKPDPTLSELISHFSGRFPDVSQVAEALPESGQHDLRSRDGKLQLTLAMSGMETRVSLWRVSEEPLLLTDADPGSVEFETEELESLRSIVQHAPYLVWCETPEGRIIWANMSYMELTRRAEPDEEIQPWPPMRLFEMPEGFRANALDATVSHRMSVSLADASDPLWFDVHPIPLDSRTMFTAVACDKIVQMEETLSGFVQTLTKTFAYLDTGLAIFDRNRKLTMFNPALPDLTGLRPEFLTARPGLHAFLDKLRDRRMIPEPRDYKSWRQQVYELETEAVEGSYEDLWSLPDGRIFQVNGKPHPDGAVAFMFKNVSDEYRLSREHRSEVEILQGALDAMEEAVAVFDRSGQLQLANARYRELWELPDTDSAKPLTLFEASAQWSAACAPSPVWGDIRAFSGNFSERTEWTASVRLRSGQGLACRVVPINRGSTLVAFTQEPSISTRHSMDSLAVLSPLPADSGMVAEHG